MQLSEHFTLEELCHSDVALRKGLDNTPDAETVANLTELAMALERVRELLGVPLHINSGYRSPKVNAAIGGSSTSAHTLGYAADFIAPEFGDPKEICNVITGSGFDYDQLIYEGTWVHFSIDPRLRHQDLTAHFGNGKVTYTQGIG